MYKEKPLRELIDQECAACRFCVFDDERKKEGCELYGCVGHSLFQEYTTENAIKK